MGKMRRKTIGSCVALEKGRDTGRIPINVKSNLSARKVIQCHSTLHLKNFVIMSTVVQERIVFAKLHKTQLSH